MAPIPTHYRERPNVERPSPNRSMNACSSPGEACSRNQFSTAHGAYLTGIAAAEQAIAALRKRRS